MVPKDPSVLEELWSRHEVRYLIVAGSTSLFYLLLFMVLLLLPWHYFAAILVAQVITIACAFPLYRRVIFRSTGPVGGDFARFMGVWATGAIAGVIGTPILVEFVRLPPWWAQAVAIVVVAVGSYLGHRFVSFRSHGPVG